MSNYIEYNDKIAFHPGYYIKEIVDEMGLTQADFARKLDTTPKNLSVLINGEQSLSIDIATKLSRMLGTSVNYWLNLQQSYDAMKAEIISNELLQEETMVFKVIDYDFYVECYHLPKEKRELEQIKHIREYLKIASLNVLKEKDLSANFRTWSEIMTEADVINSNAFVQIAMNEAIKTELPKYNKKKFIETIKYIEEEEVELQSEGIELLKTSGVNLIMLPCISTLGINALTKKVGGSVLMAINENRKEDLGRIFSEEAQNILNGEFGLSFNS